MNGWIGELFHPDNVDRTVDQLVEHQQVGRSSGQRDKVRERLTAAETKLHRLQAAIEAGAEPVALVDSLNRAQAEKAAAEAELANMTEPSALDRAEIYAMVDSLGDVGAALGGASVEKLARLYRDVRLDMWFDYEKEAVDATTSLRVNSAGVRGRSYTLTTTLRLS
ncbi:hypothetical protein [Amycolatopsis samaneae]|uniref:Uncharacterized protein n=1 Tax=Amycolatopsis samaneae TaxID=664691 RepID=A0ABW5GXF5_9PSEU